MVYSGMLLAILSGVCNGLFSAPMKLETRWKWENIWFGFILVACVAMPLALVLFSVPRWHEIYSASPSNSLLCAVLFGFCGALARFVLAAAWTA
jgi:hypothetical protein